MSDLENEVNRAVWGFVARVTELVRHAALETLQSAFAGPADAAGAARVERPDPRDNHSPRRTPEDLEALARRLTALIQANPGLCIAQINRRMGTTTKDLALPIRKLVADGVIHVRGQKRSTTYFATPRTSAEPESLATFDVHDADCVSLQAVEHAGKRAFEGVAGASPASQLDAD